MASGTASGNLIAAWGANGFRLSTNSTADPRNAIFADAPGDVYFPYSITVGQNVPAPAPDALNVNGKIMMNDGGANWGELQVDCDSSPGSCYAVYAP